MPAEVTGPIMIDHHDNVVTSEMANCGLSVLMLDFKRHVLQTFGLALNVVAAAERKTITFIHRRPIKGRYSYISYM